MEQQGKWVMSSHFLSEPGEKTSLLLTGCRLDEKPGPPRHSIPCSRTGTWAAERDVRRQRRDKLWPVQLPWQDLAVLCWQSPSSWQRAGMVWQCSSLHVFTNELCHHCYCLPCLSAKEKGLFFWNFLSKMFPGSCLFLIPAWKHIMLSISGHEWRRKAQCWIKDIFGKR